jgi:undecaprenyl diphosphate synthase
MVADPASLNLPAHVAIIMDGNGRWAAQQGKPRSHGHQAGSDALKRTIEAAAQLGIGMVTVFAFSSENWRRPRSEVKHLLELFLKALSEDLRELDDNGVRISFIGDRSAFNRAIRDGMSRAEARTASNQRLMLNVAVNYGGRADITDAARRLAEQVARGERQTDSITETELDAHLGTAGLPPPDLLIRTGGEQRLSNFLLWQAAYAELHFSDALWPDFGAEHLARAVDDYSRRQRRFGGLDQVGNA